MLTSHERDDIWLIDIWLIEVHPMDPEFTLTNNVDRILTLQIQQTMASFRMDGTNRSIDLIAGELQTTFMT